MGKWNSILKGTALLTGAGLIVKIIGAAYRIPLSRLIGAEGIGLYQMAYPIYLIFLSFSTAGLPIAISKIIAEEKSRGNTIGLQRVFQSALILLLLLGLLGTFSMVLTAPWLAKRIVVDPRAVYAMWALAPAIFFMSMMAVFRGFFQGQHEMLPSAISQIIEQIVRVSVALILAVFLLEQGIEHAAAGAAFGATAGGMAGLIYLAITYLKRRQLSPKIKVGRVKIFVQVTATIEVISRLLKFALPISIAVILMPLLQTIDSIIVPAKLQAIGYTVKQATSALGILGNSWAVLYLPMIFTAAIHTNMVPAVAATKTRGLGKLLYHNIEDGLRLAMVYLVPIAVIFYLGGSGIYHLIYGAAGIEVLSWFAAAVLFLGIEQVSAGVLQGLGSPQLPLINFILGAIIKIAVTVTCTGWPGLNLAGAALGTVCGSGLTASLNLVMVKRIVGLKLSFIPPTIIGGLMMLVSGWYLKRILHLYFAWELILISFCGVLIYLGILLLTGGIKLGDIEEVTKLFRDSKMRV